MKRAFCAIAMFLALATTVRADIIEAEVASEDAEAIFDIVVNGAQVILDVQVLGQLKKPARRGSSPHTLA